MPLLLTLLIIGGAVGYAASAFLNLRLGRPAAIAAGMLGALVGGMAIKLLLGAAGALIAAVFAAALIIALGHAMNPR